MAIILKITAAHIFIFSFIFRKLHLSAFCSEKKHNALLKIHVNNLTDFSCLKFTNKVVFLFYYKQNFFSRKLYSKKVFLNFHGNIKIQQSRPKPIPSNLFLKFFNFLSYISLEKVSI